MIEFDKVTTVLGGRTILDNVSFRVEPGEVFVIVGPSGAGKSVTLKHMIGMLRPGTGKVTVHDRVVNEADSDEIQEIRQEFGVLFQQAALLEWLTVRENVALPLREKTRMDQEAIMTAVEGRLKLVGLEKDMDKHPSELSGGMRKRAGLARALIENPAIILYDEPTSGLDPVSSRSIDQLILKMKQELKLTSVVVTHDLHSALAIGSRIAMIYGGKILEVSTPEQFVKSGMEETRGFLEAQYITKPGPWEIRT